MAPNSLFAILLRSPWWISLVVAVVVLAASQALLPARFHLFGIAASIPFLVLGVVALVRQWRLPNAGQTQAMVEALHEMNWTAFQCALEQGFARSGYQVERTSGAADLRLRRGAQTSLVSARRWKAARQGEEALQGLRQVALAEDASGCVYVALGDLSPQAQRYAQLNGIELMQGPALAQLLRGVPLPP